MYKSKLEFVRPLRPNESVPIYDECPIHGFQEIHPVYDHVPKVNCLECALFALKNYYHLYDYSVYEQFHRDMTSICDQAIGEPITDYTKYKVHMQISSLFYSYFGVKLDNNLVIDVIGGHILDIRILDYDFAYLVYLLKGN